MLDIINVTITGILYMAIFISINMIFFEMTDFKKFMVQKSRRKSKLWIYRHLLNLYIALYGNRAESKMIMETRMTMMLYVMFVIIFVQKIHIIKALFIASVLIIFMYLLLRVRVYTTQVNASYEGPTYVSELINQYRINNNNMVEALEQCVRHLDNCPHAQKQTYRLSMKIKLYTKEEDIKQIVDDFSKSLNSNWAKMIANTIFLAVANDREVTDGLDDILMELKRAKSVHEKSYQNTSEGFLIVKYILSTMYFGSVYLGINYFGLSMGKYLKYQFFTPVGIKMFVINAVLFGINVLLMMLFKRRKFDIG